MKMSIRRIFSGAICIGLLLPLGACSSHTGIRALETQSTPADVLPTGVELDDTVDAESSRLLTTHKQVRYFAAASHDSSVGCIIVVPPGTDPQWFAGCGGMGAADLIVTASTMPSNMSASLVRDNADTRTLESQGWTRMHENILIPSVQGETVR
jgi:hypothetical protein